MILYLFMTSYFQNLSLLQLICFENRLKNPSSVKFTESMCHLLFCFCCFKGFFIQRFFCSFYHSFSRSISFRYFYFFATNFQHPLIKYIERKLFLFLFFSFCIALLLLYEIQDVKIKFFPFILSFSFFIYPFVSQHFLLFVISSF